MLRRLVHWKRISGASAESFLIRSTYQAPSTKTTLAEIRLFIGMCRLHTMKIGNTNKITSKARLTLYRASVALMYSIEQDVYRFRGSHASLIG